MVNTLYGVLDVGCLLDNGETGGSSEQVAPIALLGVREAVHGKIDEQSGSAGSLVRIYLGGFAAVSASDKPFDVLGNGKLARSDQLGDEMIGHLLPNFISGGYSIHMLQDGTGCADSQSAPGPDQ